MAKTRAEDISVSIASVVFWKHVTSFVKNLKKFVTIYVTSVTADYKLASEQGAKYEDHPSSTPNDVSC